MCGLLTWILAIPSEKFSVFSLRVTRETRHGGREEDDERETHLYGNCLARSEDYVWIE